MFSSIVLTLCAQLLYDKISYAGMFTICGGFGIIGKGPSINYVVLVEGRYGVAQGSLWSLDSTIDDLLHRPYLIKRGQGGGGFEGFKNYRF